MAIYIDTPQQYQVPHLMRGRPFMSSHMISDLPGIEGEAELIAFGAKVGQKREWLQKAGTHWCHFDVMNSRYKVAVAAGAIEITPRALAQLMLAKRSASIPLLHP
jgi:hypothetical protein